MVRAGHGPHSAHSGLRLTQKWSGVQSGSSTQWSFNVAIALSGTLSTVVISITATVVPTLIPVTCTNVTITSPGPSFPLHHRSQNLSRDASASELPPTTSGLIFSVSSVPPALPPLVVTGMAALPWTVQPGPVVPANAAPLTTRSLGCVSGLPAGCPSVPGGAASSQSSFLPHPGQAVSLQDSGSPSPGPSRVTHSVTFRITNEAFSAAFGNPASLEYQLLSENIRHQLQSVYHEAFSSFEGVGVLLFRPDSAAVNASLVFGGLAPGPSAREVLWTLYRKVKAAGKMLGNLSLDESSLASDGSNLTDLALETTSIHLTAMRPFQPPLLLPGSAPFVLLEKTILRQVTPVLSGFYTARPQEEPLLLFSNAGQWVGVYIEYKFQTPIGTHLPGLANHLARNIMDPAVQKSSIMANAGKAELVQYEVWLQILDQPLTKGLRDKSSPKSQKLRGMLMRWVKWGRGERREEQEAAVQL
ncbi:taste receptor cell protein 1-like [Delphinapterus leucas]|uniref:Taste receptor cell protein 1-like n=1 Tax=Delphinapterus leucas TaxID=9749 RepID=A0A7F8K4A0_DELLE|nr:taste receptor cell protein 1-like [Delphinapterus leucas]